MISGMHHCSVAVLNLERSVKFYRDILGLELLYIAKDHGDEETSKGVGVENAKMDIAMFKAGNTNVELIEYKNPKGRPYDRLPCDIGCMHLAFQVQDINKVYIELVDKGIKFNSPPIRITEGSLKGWKWTYFPDPDGAQLELVEQN